MTYKISRPWAEPGYKGNLRTTLDINPDNYPPPILDDLIGCTLECLIEEYITEEQAKRLLTHYEELKQQGHWAYPR